MKSAAKYQPGCNKGVALVLVLWLVVLLSAISLSFITNMRDEVRLTHNSTGALQATYLAEAGIYRGIAGMLHSTRHKRWPVDGSVRRFIEDGSELGIAVLSETAKIDVNYATAEMLHGLLKINNVPQAKRRSLVSAILDWRDRDSLQNIEGAEDEDYLRAGYEYGAKDAPITSVQELRLVMGMTETVYNSIKPELTVYSGSGVIDANLASTRVLAAASSGDLDKAELFVRQRDKNAAKGAQVHSYSGQAFSVASVARTASGAVAGVKAVITVDEKKPQLFEVLQWENSVTKCLLYEHAGQCYE